MAMKTWKKYDSYLLEGEWHIHTSYTDGKNTVFEYCEKAIEMKTPLLAFTEHVRKDLTYNFENFLNDIEKAKEEFDLVLLSGCEAKVLPNGELDIEKQILKELDYPIFAFHSFPDDRDKYIECLKSVLKNEYVNTWAHPGSFLLRHNLKVPEEQLVEVFKLMNKKEVLFEINRKHILPENWKSVAKKYNVKMVNGSDAHCVDEMEINKFRTI
jgi:DNA polymerase (family 10)/putative hydrolase